MTAACTACGCTADNPTPVTASLCRACAQTETPAALKARALAAEAECELLRADVTLWREFGKAAADNHSDALLEWQKGFVAFQTRAEKAERDRDRTIALANAFARAARNEIERERAARATLRPRASSRLQTRTRGLCSGGTTTPRRCARMRSLRRSFAPSRHGPSATAANSERLLRG